MAQRNEQALWISVIQQALSDYVTRPNTSKAEDRLERQRAGKWLFHKDEEEYFFAACELAGVSPREVREIARRMKKHHGEASTRHEQHRVVAVACVCVARVSVTY